MTTPDKQIVTEIVNENAFPEGSGPLQFERVKSNKFDGLVCARTDRGQPEALNCFVRRLEQKAWTVCGLASNSGLDRFPEEPGFYDSAAQITRGDVRYVETPQGEMVLVYAETENEARLIVYLATGLYDAIPRSLALDALEQIRKRYSWKTRDSYSHTTAINGLLERWNDEGKIDLAPYPERVKPEKGKAGRKSSKINPLDLASQAFDLDALNAAVGDIIG